MKNKVLDIQVGDRVTFESVKSKEIITLIVDGNALLGDLLNENYAKILKIERPKYEVIEENKEILNKEENKEILNKEEKKYLWNIIRPFKDKVKGIAKCGGTSEREYILIALKNELSISLPYFSKDSMYKNIKKGRYYSLEELGLEEQYE